MYSGDVIHSSSQLSTLGTVL
ncbi:rod shape-determining protein RodA, partial [Vibrio parahaemolyticus VP2007-007]